MLVDEPERSSACIEISQREVHSCESVCRRKSREMAGVRMIQQKRERFPGSCEFADQQMEVP